MNVTPDRHAIIYRMVMNSHTCPFGIKAMSLLKNTGYTVDDHWLSTREEVDMFKKEHDVTTTPQIFINDKTVGGYNDLRRYFGKPVLDLKATSYKPIVALFAITALIALSLSYTVFDNPFTLKAGEWFIGFSMCVLAILKFQNLETFSNMFLGYDLLAPRWVPYSYVYPWAEALAGILMIAGIFPWLAGLVALFIGSIGTASVIKAVYIDKRELKCACVGGGSNVPLGFISLTENMMMVAMGSWMLLMPFFAH